MNIDLSFINKTDIEPQIMLKGYSYGSSPNCKPQGRHKVNDDCRDAYHCRYGECDCSDCHDCHYEDCKNKVYYDCNCHCDRFGECDSYECNDCTYDCDHCDCQCDCDCNNCFYDCDDYDCNCIDVW